VKLTPAQFRDALGISQETLRHWRRSLPIFQGRKGYAPAFTSGDLVVGAVIKLLRERWGLSVTAFAEQSIALGEAVGRTSWPSLAASTLRLSLTSKDCELVPTTSRQAVDKPCLIVPLGPIIEHLTAALLEDESQSQIYFPPVPIGNKARTS
jgi:hypothetical protein